MACDALGRRISEAVTNGADWTATYPYYYDGYRTIAASDGGDVLHPVFSRKADR